MSQINTDVEESNIPTTLNSHERDLVILNREGHNIELNTPWASREYVSIKQSAGRDSDIIIIKAHEIDNLINCLNQLKEKMKE